MNTGKIMTSKDILLLLLYVPGATGKRQEAIHGRSRLQKMVFLFEKEVYKKFQFDRLIDEKDLPVFIPMYFGPYSGHVFDDLDFLWNLSFVNIRQAPDEQEVDDYLYWLKETGLSDEASVSSFEVDAFNLTGLGTNFVEEHLIPYLSQKQYNALEVLKRNCTKVTLHQLLSYMYSKYPEFSIQAKSWRL